MTAVVTSVYRFFSIPMPIRHQLLELLVLMPNWPKLWTPSILTRSTGCPKKKYTAQNRLSIQTTNETATKQTPIDR